MRQREKQRIFLLLGCYFLLHLLFKVLLSDGVELDEAEQFLWAQDFRIGYGAELPLYTWLQACFFTVLGTNLFAVVLLKCFLLFAACLFTYLGAREASGDERCAAAAMLTLSFIPQIVWESQRVLTHTVLATALAAMVLYFFLRIVKAGEIRDYLLLGLAAGLGMLAKYNFGIFLLALALSGLSLRSFRPRIADKKSALALAVLLIVISVPISWIALHPDLSMTKTHKLYMAGNPGAMAGALTGVRHLLESTAGFAFLPVLLYSIIFLRAPRIFPADPGSRDSARFIGRTMLFALLICLLLILLCGFSRFRIRWVQPLLFPLPIFLSLVVRERLDESRLRKVGTIAAGVAVAVLISLHGRVPLAGYFKPGSENEPYSALSEQIARKGFSNGLIVAENGYLGGNLKPRFRTCRIIAPDIFPASSLPSPLSMPLLVVWDAEESKGMPNALKNFLLNRFGTVEMPPSPFLAEAPYNWAPGHKMRLEFVILKP